MPLGEISGLEWGVDVDAVIGVIVPAPAGQEVIVVSWDKYSLETDFHIARRTVVAWRVGDLAANPIIAGEAINEKSGQTFLIPHPDGTSEWPFMGVFESIEQAVAEIKEGHRMTLTPVARSDDSAVPECS